METTVKQRLIRFIKYKRLSQKKFEEAVGVSNGYVNNISKGIGADKLQRILGVYPELNQAWLLTGEGEMLNTSDVAPVTFEGPPAYLTENSHGNKYYKDTSGQLYIEVPLVQYNALGSLLGDDDLLVSHGAEKVRFPADTVGHGKYFAFEVDGDSMDDGSRHSFARGDRVLVRELDKDDWLPTLHIKRWRFWVVCWGNCVRLKEIIAQDGEAITLHSLNPSPEYTDFQLRLSEVSRLFNVIQLQPKPQKFL